MAFNPNNLKLVHTLGSPFADDPPDAEKYYAAIGRVMVLWGRFEQNLEDVISALGFIPRAPRLSNGRPRNFKKKVERLKELCRETPALKHLYVAACAFSSKALLAGQKRHALVHSNWQGFVPNAVEPAMKFANIIWDGDTARPMKRDVPLKELDALLAAIQELNGDAVNFYRVLVQLSARAPGGDLRALQD